MTTFHIPDSARVLVLEDDFCERVEWFRERLPHATLVRNPLIAIEALKARDYRTVFLDHDVPCPEDCTGMDVARFLISTEFTGRVVIHSANPWAARSMEDILQTKMPTLRAQFGTFLLNESVPAAGARQ